MKRLHVHVSVAELAPARAFYTAMFGVEPDSTADNRADWRLAAPPLDLTIAVDGRPPGLDRLSIDAGTAAELASVVRRLGAANLVVAHAAQVGGPAAADANRAIDPMGLVWQAHAAEPAPGSDAVTGQRPFADSAGGARVLNILFLCTGNSARSIMAEAIMNRIGAGRFRAWSAGSMPKGAVHPEAVRLLGSMNHVTDDLRSKSWEEFSGADAPRLDFVFTLCDNAAAEVCPIWPGQPMSAHWGLPDPAAVTESPALAALAFADTYRMLTQRISIFTSLPIASLDRLSLQRQIDRVGRS